MLRKIINTEMELFILNNFTYDPLDGSLYKKSRLISAKNEKGYIVTEVIINNKKQKFYAHQIIYRLYYDKWCANDKIIDHLDGNKANNKIDNLREVSYKQNKMNVSQFKNRKYKYVYERSNKSKLYNATITLCIPSKDIGKLIKDKWDNKLNESNVNIINNKEILPQVKEFIYKYIRVDFETGEIFQTNALTKKEKLVTRKNEDGYIICYLNRVNDHRYSFRGHQIVFYLYHGYLPSVVDHKNGIRDDNRIENLRASNNLLNARNIKNKTGNVGVSEQDGKFYVQIRSPQYDNEIKCAKIADWIIYEETNGEDRQFLKLNFPIEENEYITKQQETK